MEQKSIETYAIRWHENVKEDFESVPKHEVESIVAHSNHVLCQFPYLAGEQVKGKNSPLRRIKHGSYRVIFVVVGKEAWILSVQHRKNVYRDVHIETLIRIGLMLRQRSL